jgi:hypothetical protein
MPNNIASIEAQLKELEKHIHSSSSDNDVKELLTIIHRPGWTTPAEALLVQELVEATIASVKQAAHLRQALLKGAKAVGTPATAGIN